MTESEPGMTRSRGTPHDRHQRNNTSHNNPSFPILQILVQTLRHSRARGNPE